jgi:hypothetical protein
MLGEPGRSLLTSFALRGIIPDRLLELAIFQRTSEE